MNEVNNTLCTDYKKLLTLTFFLFFGDSWTIKSKGTVISSTKYSLLDLINSIDSVPQTVSQQEAINKGSYSIDDIIYGEYELSSNDYNDIVNGYSDKDGWDEFLFQGITYLYANKNFEDLQEKEIIHFLFHFFYKVGVPRGFNISEIDYYSRPNMNNFKDELKDSLIIFAKYIIKKEINSYIGSITPEYDDINMKPKWIVHSLLSAMYFSLFYIDGKKETWRRCEYCGGYFLVKRTRRTQIYCNGYCRQNAQSANHRQRMKEKKEAIRS